MNDESQKQWVDLTVTVSPEVPPPTQCEDVDDIGGPDVKVELPAHLSTTKDVMERCVHLLSDPCLRLRLKVPSLGRRERWFEDNNPDGDCFLYCNKCLATVERNEL